MELSHDLTRMSGLYVDCGIRGSRLVPSHMIDLLGEVSIIINGNGKRASIKTPAFPRRALSTDGQLIGAVSDAMIDENAKSVTALLLTRGYIDDLLVGRHWVRQFTVNRDSGDVVCPENDHLTPKTPPPLSPSTIPKGGDTL